LRSTTLFHSCGTHPQSAPQHNTISAHLCIKRSFRRTKQRQEQQKGIRFWSKKRDVEEFNRRTPGYERTTCICLPPPLGTVREAPSEAAIAASWWARWGGMNSRGKEGREEEEEDAMRTTAAAPLPRRHPSMPDWNVMAALWALPALFFEPNTRATCS
jgi:hypothetical protein